MSVGLVGAHDNSRHIVSSMSNKLDEILKMQFLANRATLSVKIVPTKLTCTQSKLG